jgi:hypothetical protein
MPKTFQVLWDHPCGLKAAKMDAPVFYFASITIRNVPELQAQYPFMGIKNIGEPVDTLSQFHYDTHDTDRL